MSDKTYSKKAYLCVEFIKKEDENMFEHLVLQRFFKVVFHLKYLVGTIWLCVSAIIYFTLTVVGAGGGRNLQVKLNRFIGDRLKAP